MRIGQKITLGFIVILVLAGLLGALALVTMRSAAQKADALATKQVPAVTMANSIERRSQETLFQIRGYTMSDNDDMRVKGEESLRLARQEIDQAHQFAVDHGLPHLQEDSETAAKQAKLYSDLLEQTKQARTAEQAAIADRGVAAETLTSVAQELIADQNDKLAREIATDPGQAKIAERCLKVKLANEIMELVDSIRIISWKSQATRKPQLFQDKLPTFVEIAKRCEQLLPLMRDAKNIEQLHAIATAAEQYRAAAENYIARTTELTRIGELRLAAGTAVIAAAQNAAEVNIGKTADASTAAAGDLAGASTVMGIGLVVVVLLGLAAALLITRGIVKALVQVSEELGACSEQTASAAQQVASGAQSLANGTSETAATLEETSASLEEMSSMVRQSAQSSEAANGVASQARAAGERGQQAMAELAQAIGEIKSNADQTAKIIKTIDEIAFQTNLLALNAAVEAARAGDAGKGFAVVAQEVRNLAQRAGEAARNTSQLIEQSVKSADSGVKLSQHVTGVVAEMTSASKKVNDLAGEVAASAKEITIGIDQVSRAVRQMDQTTQANAASAEENSAVGEEMSAQAMSLANLVQDLEAMIRAAQERGTPAAAHAPTQRSTATRAPTVPARATNGVKSSTQVRTNSTNGLKPYVPQSESAKQAIPFSEDGQDDHATLGRF